MITVINQPTEKHNPPARSSKGLYGPSRKMPSITAHSFMGKIFREKSKKLIRVD